MNSRCMHVDLLLKVPGLCQVRVFCAALYRISAELLQVDTCGILKKKKNGVCLCFVFVQHGPGITTKLKLYLHAPLKLTTMSNKIVETLCYIKFYF